MWTLKTAPYPNKISHQLMDQAQGLLGRSDLGYLQLASRDRLWSDSKERAERLRQSHDHLMVVGMGGSSLGARAFLSALCGPERGGVSFIDNVDPRSLDRILALRANDPKTHWVLVSKSGSTIETLFAANHLLQRSQRSDLIKNGLTVITEPRSNPLKDWANQNQVASLEIPVDVGGRFSVFTPVGLLPLAFAGLNLEEIRGGLQGASFESLSLELTAQYWQSLGERKWIHAFWSYADDLLDLGYWFQQLWAESLAKAQDRSGQPAPRVSTPLVLRGASDQHSVLQQLMEGQGGRLITFLRVSALEDLGPELLEDHFGVQDNLVGRKMGNLLGAEAEATELALSEAGVPCLRLVGQALTERSLAYLVQTLMICTGMLGELLNINAFDQPGVEAGKKIAKSLLASR